jgi:hypothetical protein
MIHRRLQYDTERFPLSSCVAAMLGVDDLTQLPEPPHLTLLRREDDQQLGIYRQFYSHMDEFRQLYEAFVAHVAPGIMQEAYCFQAVPNLRIQYANNVAVGEIHRDRDYHHPSAEVNFWTPLTDAWDTNTIWVEYQQDRMAPISGGPGEVIVFDAANVRHGNVLNKTGCTRVSIDFRCLALSQYRENDERTLNSGLAFRVGEFYKLPD